MPRNFAQIGLALGCLIYTAEPILAETTPSPADDLAKMMALAVDDAFLQTIMRQLNELKGQPGIAPGWIEDRFNQNMPGGRFSGKEPIRYRIVDQVQEAEARARYYGEIMGADLNNDGSISKQEVKDALSIRPIQGAAEAFFSSDANDDGILSPEEIRSAVGQLSGIRTRARNSNAMRLFDFDDDGVLTSAERERGLKALGLDIN